MTESNESERVSELLSSVAKLPRSIEPPVDQWPDIQRRIDQGRVIPLHAESSASSSPRVSQPVRTQIGLRRYLIAASAAAALILAAYLGRRTSLPGTTLSSSEVPATHSEAPIDSTSSLGAHVPRIPGRSTRTLAVAGSSDADRANVMRAFNAYEDAARDLSWSLDARRSQLDPRTLAVVDTCLKEIDKAIREARAALGRNPGSGLLSDFLQSSYQQKLDLLKRAVEGPRRTI